MSEQPEFDADEANRAIEQNVLLLSQCYIRLALTHGLNPLEAILVMSEILKRLPDVVDPRRVKHYIDEVRANAAQPGTQPDEHQ